MKFNGKILMEKSLEKTVLFLKFTPTLNILVKVASTLMFEGCLEALRKNTGNTKAFRFSIRNAIHPLLFYRVQGSL